MTKEPKYRIIASDLREAIQRGEYAPGSRLPGENDLMRDYQVARMTARQALAQLINEGTASARQGAGVYVRDFRPIIRDGITRLAGTWTAGRSVWSADAGDRTLKVDQLRVQHEDPPDRVRLLLDLPEASTQVLVRRRRFVLDGKPVLLSASYLPADVTAGSLIEQEDTGPGGTYARLAEVGNAPVRFREDLRCRMPEPAEAKQLDIGPGTPVVDIVRTAYTSSDRVVEVNEMTADSSSYVFRYDFSSQQ